MGFPKVNAYGDHWFLCFGSFGSYVDEIFGKGNNDFLKMKDWGLKSNFFFRSMKDDSWSRTESDL